MAFLRQRPHLFWSGLAIIVLLAELALFLDMWSGFSDSERWTIHTHLVLEKLESVRSTIKDAETGQRGYLLTGDERYLAPYHQATASLAAGLRELAGLTADNPRQQSRVRQLQSLFDEKLATLNDAINVRRAWGAAAAAAVVQTDRGKRATDDIRGVFRSMQAEERALLEQRSARTRASAKIVVVEMLAGAGLLLLVLVIGIREIDRSVNGRLRAEAAERAQRQWLEVTLSSIGDGVIATDAQGRITLVNPVAARLTGWSSEDARQRLIESVFVIRNEETGAAVENPALCAMREGRVVALANHTTLLSRDGRQFPIDDSGAPIYDSQGQLAGAVLIFRDMTEKKAREAELLRRDRILRHSLDAIIIADAERRIVSWNRGATELYQWDETEAQNKVTHELLHTFPDMAEVDKILAEKGEWHGELEHTRKDGTRITVESRQVARRDPNGAVAGLLEINRDITDRKRAEQAVLQQRQWLRVTLQSIGDAVLATDAAGAITFLNPIAAALTGWPEEQVLGLPASEVFRIINEDTRQPAADIIGNVLRDRCIVSLANHTALVARDGREIPIEDSAAPIQDADGQLLGVVLVFHDVTGARRVQAALQESEARERARASELQAMMDAVPAAVFVSTDPECREIFGNRTSYELLRLPPGTNLSKSAPEGIRPAAFRTVKGGRDIPATELPAQVAARTGKPVRNYEFEFVFHDGSARTMLGDAVPFLAEDGSPCGSVGAFMDVTDRKRAEERLWQAQKLESIGLLAGGIAHDFNNLLIGVIGTASLAQDMLPPGHEVSDLLQRIVRTGEELAHLTRQMLAYSGKGQVFVESLCLSDRIPEIGALVEPSISKKITVRYELDSTLPLIEADRAQVQQVFMNLLLNAAEAIGAETGLITVRTAVEVVDDRYLQRHPEAAGLPPGEYVCLQVRDTGCGMDAKTRSKIFDPFFTTKFMGRGLGLAAVSGIVRAHKGIIQVDTAPGEGSCFSVLIPAVERKSPALRPEQETAAPRGSGTVLVVDDEEVVRELARRALTRQGFDVLLAQNGIEAIDVLKRHPGEIALVVLDLSMPGMSGEEALPELRKIRPAIRVVLSSGYNEDETLALFQGHPVSGFIQKPYTATALARKVGMLLNHAVNNVK